MSNNEIIAAQKAEIEATLGADVSVFVETFNFRTSKELPEGADWPAVTTKEADPETGEPIDVIKGYKRESFPVALYRPTAAALASYLSDACPEQDTILEIIEDFIFSAAQDIISANPGMTAADFPLDKIAFAVLARLPKEVKTRGLDKEELAAFCKDYIEVMPEITGKSAEVCALAAGAFEKRFSNVKTDQVAQKKLRAYLDLYIAKAPRAEAFQTVLGVLVQRLEQLMVAETVNLGDVL